MGTTGFPDGKGGDGMLPIGPLLVIPRDADGFTGPTARTLRERPTSTARTSGPDDLVACRDRVPGLRRLRCRLPAQSGSVPLTDCAGDPRSTLILTGTPAGVMFHLLTIWSARAYLEPGDEVGGGASLGVLHNRVR